MQTIFQDENERVKTEVEMDSIISLDIKPQNALKLKSFMGAKEKLFRAQKAGMLIKTQILKRAYYGYNRIQSKKGYPTSNISIYVSAFKSKINIM